MKIFSTSFLWILLFLIGFGCSDEMSSDGQDTSEVTDPVYIKFTVGFRSEGTSTRSATTDPDDDDYVTSEDGKEIGKDRENHIQEILLLFADKEGKYIHSGNYPITQKPSNTYVISMSLARLEEYNRAGDIRVYLFCNPGDALKRAAGQLTAGTAMTDFLNGSYTIAEGESEDSRAWQDNRFFMSNAIPHTAYFPGSWPDYRDEGTPWSLGTIRVERSVARFDYRAKMSNNIYRVYDKTDGSTAYSRNPQVYIQLTDVALVNMSKSFYYWRRVSNAADGISNPEISGTETPVNYVVDTDATRKRSYTKKNWPDKTDYFFYNLESPADRVFTRLSDIADNEEDEDESWNNDQVHNGYHIWRYASENTIPNVERQRNGITTGIMFKAVIKAAEGSSLEKMQEAGRKIYVFDNKLYGDWEAVEQAAATGENEELKKACEAVNSGSSLKQAGFTVYAPDTRDGNYYTYYYYWNRHNDNRKAAVMGPMEFAVVRNNVYKLQVDAIYRFGYPEGTYPDPNTPDEVDPEDPEKPDPDPTPDPDPDPDPEPTPDPDPEPKPDPTPHLKLTVEVLPWVVREYEINFGDKQEQ
ncbi:Mfa1 family fimbria major subunit [Parabacteroides timonensis]|uniref:Mfa1 family fimbria major subunit n=1 Tax=Parabacteroides timonensis TaxID=1871013 RepID=UPI000AFC97EE|nr:Mfa1 family fimbria major subunit [Parabacteroides timonensis]